VLAVDTLMAAIMGAEGQHSRASGRDVPLKTAVLHKRRCSSSPMAQQRGPTHGRGLHVGKACGDSTR